MTQISNVQVETTKRVAAKFQALYDGLAEDEQLVFGLVVRKLVAGEETDTQGFMKPVYDDGSGNKGRPGPGPGNPPRLGGGLTNPSVWNTLIIDPDSGYSEPLNLPG
jgi:hypothetical protein